jgi:hypothetical protein
MLSKSRCPHTGVINFFTAGDPQLAVGSVAEVRTFRHYVWRCYVGSEASGLEPDVTSAEARLREAIAGGSRQRRSKRARNTSAAPGPAGASDYWRHLNEAASLSGRGSGR